LRRKPPSPNSSNTGSLSSINALNSSHNGSTSSSTNIYDRKLSINNPQPLQQQQLNAQNGQNNSVFGN
jgi:hypothetical protein